MPEKCCTHCKTTKPLTEFSRTRRAKDGLNTWCKICMQNYQNIHKATKWPEKTCQQCNKLFRAKPSSLRLGYANFCSRACFFADRKAQLDADFWNRVDRSGGPNACWLWTGSRNPCGYGVFRRKPYTSAHRFSWKLHYGTIPYGLNVLHACDIPACVRPEHLFLGTQKHNILDAITKKRWTQKLSRQHILSIRHLQGQYSANTVANMFHITRHYVNDIWSRRRWAHLE